MENLGPVDVTTLKERVYLRLREAISHGDFMPGEVLTIRTLAASLGTSAMPVREALLRLVAESALVQQPNRGFAVAPFTSDTFRELARIRMSTEALATRYATRNADAALLDNLRALNVQMRDAILRSDADTALEANRSFHFSIYAAADMPQLLGIIRGLWLRTGPYLGAAYRHIRDSNQHFLNGTRIHTRIIADIERGDAQRAGRGIALDIWSTARRFRSAIEQISDVTKNMPNAAQQKLGSAEDFPRSSVPASGRSE